MPARWEKILERWSKQGLIDDTTAARIREFEAAHEQEQGLRWPVLLAIGLGGLLLGASVLLFVAAHWEELSPATRFALVLSMVGVFHVAGALLTERFPTLSRTLHAVGTIALGGGIFLAGQIFHLQEHWPTGMLLWAIGAIVAWAILRDWTQGTIVALLVPWWLGGEWTEITYGMLGNDNILFTLLLLLSLTYLSAIYENHDSPLRKSLMWIGGLSVLPLAIIAAVTDTSIYSSDVQTLPGSYHVWGWAIAIALSLGLAFWLRGKAVWMNAIACLWVILFSTTNLVLKTSERDTFLYIWDDLGTYIVAAIGAVGLIIWGIHESRKERINIGVAGFALTVLVFYFSSVMDKLGRATSLLGLGLLFILGGWLLERTRRKLLQKMEEEA